MCLGMCIGMAIGAKKDKQINDAALTIKEIVEDEFGCEGRPEGEEPQVAVIVTDKDGVEKSIRMADKVVYERQLETGDRVWLKEDGTLELIDEKEAPKEKK